MSPANVLEAFISPQSWDWRIITILALLLPFIITYITTSLQASIASAAAKSTNATVKDPIILPYSTPLVGHLFPFLKSGDKVLKYGIKRCGSIPFKLRLGPTYSIYMISGAEMVTAYFKESRRLSGIPGFVLAMEQAFGVGPKAAKFYAADDSGMYPTPWPTSTTKPEDRINYIIHKMVNTYLTGSSLDSMTARYQQNLARKVSEAEIGDEWVDIPDFYRFFQAYILEAAVSSMYGNYILSLNPTFAEDFADYDKRMHSLMYSLPRWMDSKAYAARDKMNENIKRWHRYAHQHYDVSGGKAEKDECEWEPYFGSKFGRVRQATFMKMPQMDETGRAGEDLGILWASNANSIPAAAWFLLEILLSPSLLPRVRSELTPSLNPSLPGLPRPTFNVPSLCSGPLLQSIYAETLRLRVAIMSTRVPVVPDFQLKGWRFKQNEMIAWSSAIESFDEKVWSTGSPADPHPLDEFWSDRFLIYPNDPFSGPLKKPKPSLPPTSQKGKEKGTEEDEKPRFSLEGLSSSWLPYAGGVRLCPGRHFAKQEMISSAAIFLTAFDIELKVPQGFIPEVDQSYFGFGTMPPKGVIPARIRRRKF